MCAITRAGAAASMAVGLGWREIGDSLTFEMERSHSVGSRSMVSMNRSSVAEPSDDIRGASGELFENGLADTVDLSDPVHHGLPVRPGDQLPSMADERAKRFPSMVAYLELGTTITADAHELVERSWQDACPKSWGFRQSPTRIGC